MSARSIRRLARSLVLAGLLLGSVASAHAEDVLVFAAASLKTALDRIATDWEQATGHTVAVSYAGSSQLARQIEQGAPADIYISASTDWMDYLQKSGLIKDATRVDLLSNSLVLIAHGAQAEAISFGPDTDLAGMLGDERLAMAMVDSVPAGIYGKMALTQLGLWDEVAPKVAQTDNVRAALALVSSGEAPYGIVYATDALVDENVRIIASFPATSHAPIVYPAAMVHGSVGPEARGFFAALSGADAEAVFRQNGFLVPPGHGDG
ncbi:molybdate ABC transporter substrate-binding protein [Hoeflea sp.]|uniref:molybdate ABC transporter substrate-binding protein n=1 Tax=Hoeflea sp. TaxID=1940281 RepID=UPI003A9398EA